ncbi:glycosyltransferase [Methylophilus sp. YYY-1]|uniref:glycosyltransferase n=1 Tax=Methylophilus sp. YYY-1 TaxID=2682087 RepID=UPI0023B2B21A|nr:glycosyltransferase [Methylophilus sp. YYY-1]MDF0377971.1 glycosyltransferase [Methylophilus sp. YYY-1]
MKKKMAIVSSYSESCGNAAFTKVIHDSIEKFFPEFDVEVLELDLSLLQSVDFGVRPKGDEHIKCLASKLTGFDIVNIQLEAGLYGSLPRDIIKRFGWLVKANPNTSVTFHSPRLISTTPSGARLAFKKILMLKIKSGLKDLFSNLYLNTHLKINKGLLRKAVNANARVIVHTTRAKKQIGHFFDYKNITLHPLKLVPYDFVPNKSVLSNIRTRANLSKDDVLIGMFGYISGYKGHMDALEALKLLPENYKLVIFGRQHPQTLKSNGKVDEYLSKLIKNVLSSKELKSRVFFLGELNDEDFLSVASQVDISWLPYYENGQDGSGIASICLDLCPRVLCSTSFAFDELFKQVRYTNVSRFDIGNILEMALKTNMILAAPIPQMPYGDEATYNIKTQAEAYVNG